MKRSGATILFIVVCAAVLAAAYAAGICIREVRFSIARNNAKTTAVSVKPTTEPEVTTEQARRTPGPGGMDARRNLASGDRPGLDEQRGGFRDQRGGDEQRGDFGDQRAAMRERLDNMSDEEREQFMSQMRDRFAGRRRENMPQLSEEDRAKMREELEELRARSEEMSEEEMSEARAKIFEKYGMPSRGFGGRMGGGRNFGGGESGRRRPSTRSDEGQI